jgi:hypothetical protein
MCIISFVLRQFCFSVITAPARSACPCSLDRIQLHEHSNVQGVLRPSFAFEVVCEGPNTEQVGLCNPIRHASYRLPAEFSRTSLLAQSVGREIPVP